VYRQPVPHHHHDETGHHDCDDDQPGKARRLNQPISRHSLDDQACLQTHQQKRKHVEQEYH
jgi:hypothetical protein